MSLVTYFCLNKDCEDRISALPDDLLLHILSQLQTKYAVKTMILSKRWRFVWPVTPKLDYSESYQAKKSVWEFLDKSLQHHKANLLETLNIHLDPRCPVDADIGKWLSHAVCLLVREINLEFFRFRSPKTLPSCLYTSKTLLKLTLSNQILIDVPSEACLPLLQSLNLTLVVYKDQDSHVRLLSSCPALQVLSVVRDVEDNMTKFSVNVPSLEKLTYMDNDSGVSGRSLVIDSPRLSYVKMNDLKDSFLIKNMPRLDEASVNSFFRFDKKILSSFSSVKFLNLALTYEKLECCSTINFSRLIELNLTPSCFDSFWLESLMILLHHSPKLKVLRINSFIGTNRVLYRFACCLNLRYLSGKNMEEAYKRNYSLLTSSRTRNL
ncbi:unnamed protein product [Cochlearia groenlandica]